MIDEINDNYMDYDLIHDSGGDSSMPYLVSFETHSIHTYPIMINGDISDLMILEILLTFLLEIFFESIDFCISKTCQSQFRLKQFRCSFQQDFYNHKLVQCEKL